jgi:uncharacterized membrane protein
VIGRTRARPRDFGRINVSDHRPRGRAGRAPLKAITFRLATTAADFLLVYLLTHRAALAFGFILASNAYTVAGYFLHERIWAHISWGKAGDVSDG